MYLINNCVGGKKMPSKGSQLPIFNPATGKEVGSVHRSTTEEVNEAVNVAKLAFQEWQHVPPARRARMMFKFREIIEQNQDDLAREISREHGKTHADALGEIARGLEIVEFACGIPQLLMGNYSRNVGSMVDSYDMRQALGVVAGITPFNFPAMVPMWMFPIAMACGNTFVLKPSERDPSASVMMFEFAQKAGFPDGVFNVVHGDKVAVDALLTHPEVAAISFVGSTPIAEYIYHTGNQHNKRVQALGGAKNHMVIMPDADMKQAADALMGAAFGSAGERCMAISVAVPVGEETHKRLIDELKPRIEALKVGPSTQADAEMGPVITRASFDRIHNLVASGVEQGARLVVDGRNLKVKGHEGGFFVGGTLFTDVTCAMDIYKEEIFGPVLCVAPVADYQAAFDLISSNQYGNGTAIFTRDGDTARDFADKIQVGMVGINVPIPVPVGWHSFGGWKRSLFGDHSIYGSEGVHFYTRLKTVTSRWPTGIKEGAVFNFPS